MNLMHWINSFESIAGKKNSGHSKYYRKALYSRFFIVFRKQLSLLIIEIAGAIVSEETPKKTCGIKRFLLNHSINKCLLISQS